MPFVLFFVEKNNRLIKKLMVVKILSTSSKFNGVDYNDRKTKNGQAELMEVRNFGLLEMKEGRITKEEYIAYMQKFCESNSRIKNKQFHAVISCKGKEYTPEQLKEIASQYLEKMGYAQNPYLIYYHSDTANNHVHVISTRVDEHGNKINDSYEGVRSQAAIQEILQVNPANEFKADLKNSLSYSFSSQAQFALLMEKLGYQLKQEGDDLKFFKYDQLQGEVRKQELAFKMAENLIDKKRLQQVQAIFRKYQGMYPTVLNWKGNPLPGGGESKKKGVYGSLFSAEMAKKFELELVFHSKEGQIPYGYTILDHSNKQIYKGSQVMTLAELLSPVSKQGRGEGAKTFVSEALHNLAGLRGLKTTLTSNGYSINDKGQIKLKGKPEIIYQLPFQDIIQLGYQDRVKEAQRYRISTNSQQYIIANQFTIKKEDLVLSERNLFEQKLLGTRLSSVLQNSGNPTEGLFQEGLEVLLLGKELFIRDKEKTLLIELTELLSLEQRQSIEPELLRSNPIVIAENIEHQEEPLLDGNYSDLDKPTYPVGKELETDVIDHEDNVSQRFGQSIEEVFGAIKDDKQEQRKKKKR